MYLLTEYEIEAEKNDLLKVMKLVEANSKSHIHPVVVLILSGFGSLKYPSEWKKIYQVLG